ncbi:hypothetical protein [Desertivirga arenae]|uniref:hypothetical protein n=1 Tax=Desertivirga arenae TaxID=2810309 RepID=UPI001A96BCE9|nr:hypothetical protein [Pedobacter sp. SYSU D00823]
MQYEGMFILCSWSGKRYLNTEQNILMIDPAELMSNYFLLLRSPYHLEDEIARDVSNIMVDEDLVFNGISKVIQNGREIATQAYLSPEVASFLLRRGFAIPYKGVPARELYFQGWICFQNPYRNFLTSEDFPPLMLA